MLEGVDSDTYRKLLLSVGSHRGTRPLSPVEVGAAISSSIEAGESPRSIATALHLDGTTMISRFAGLLGLPDEIRYVVDWGRSGSTIAFTAAAELSRLSNIDDQVLLCREALERQLSSAEVKSVVQLRARSNKPMEECIDDIVRLRPRRETLHVFIGGVTDERVKEKLRTLPQVERDEIMHRALRKSFPSLQAASVRLGVDRFTIAGNDAIARGLNDSGGTVEQRIEQAIGAEL